MSFRAKTMSRLTGEAPAEISVPVGRGKLNREHVDRQEGPK
jgi:hypothetical protein